MSSIKSFTVEYNPSNKHYIFSSGEGISGQINLELSKGCEVKSLCIKLKGKAEVKWTENHGKTSTTYHNKEKYFSIKQYIFQELKDGQGHNLIQHGCHVYPFTFHIPSQQLPSSFKGVYGKILYTLEANLSRYMRLDSNAKAEFTLLHKANLDSDPGLKAPQHSVIDKKMSVFNSGSVSMDVNVDRTGYYQGEGMKVVASIDNRSSREIKPKYSLNAKYSFFAKNKRKLQLKEILKEVGEVVPPSSNQTVTKIITIPPELNVSIHNCSILKVEYRLKVYLDVKYASDPEIKFPIMILPAIARSEVGDSDFPPAFGFEAFQQPDMYGGASLFESPPATAPSAPPPPYGTYGMYPSLGGFNQNTY